VVVVRVTRIQSYKDRATGKLGKQIEFSEIRSTPSVTIGGGEETRIIKQVLDQMSVMGFPIPISSEIKTPKMVLFLTQEEEELFGVEINVNRVYELVFKNKSIIFKELKEY
jgi:hypothetical protein